MNPQNLSSHNPFAVPPVVPAIESPTQFDTASGADSILEEAGPAEVPAQALAMLQGTAVARGKIMIVDDEIANVLIAKKMLAEAGHEEFETTTDSSLTMNLLHTSEPDVLLLDINMPDVSGISILTQIRSTEKFRHLPVLVLTANNEVDVKLKCLELGATDFLVKPIDPMELAPRVRNALLGKMYQDQLADHAAKLERVVRQRTEKLVSSRREVIHALARAAELRDNETGNHVTRVGLYAGIIARNLGLTDRYCGDIELAAQLHDVGKIAVPDSILLKPGKLTPVEYKTMQSHVKYGQQIIRPYLHSDAVAKTERDETHDGAASEGSSLMRLAANIAQTHHEKYDGSGYPIGLAGDDIPLEGRITAVADVFDALSSRRPYKDPYPQEKCFRILKEGRGKHFDPDVLDAFFAGAAEIVRIQVEFVDCQ